MKSFPEQRLVIEPQNAHLCLKIETEYSFDIPMGFEGASENRYVPDLKPVDMFFKTNAIEFSNLFVHYLIECDSPFVFLACRLYKSSALAIIVPLVN